MAKFPPFSVCVSEQINYRANNEVCRQGKAAVANCADPIQIYLARYWIWGRSQRRPALPMSCAVTDIPVAAAVLRMETAPVGQRMTQLLIALPEPCLSHFVHFGRISRVPSR